MAKSKKIAKKQQAANYKHPEADSPMRPDVGTQAQFRKKKPPATYRYDSSLAPALDYDGQNATREQGEALIQQILDANSVEAAKEAAAKLKALSKPFLNWAGKAERLSFDVPTLPLFVHERLSTKAIIETLTGHRRDKQISMFDLFSDPQHPIADQVLKAYEHRDKWVNRMVLGDSLVVMNSLLHYESLGGQVQMIYMDPPYGVKFGSNFQPFVRKRDVKHNDDEDLTREPEMVQAYRDTWELGLHSYLTYLRDRLLLCRELLHPSGSVFVQISDENLHHVREVMDEVFGPENVLSLISFTKAGAGLEAADRLAARIDYLVWYARDADHVRYRPLFEKRADDVASGYGWVELSDGKRRRLTREERSGDEPLPAHSRLFGDVDFSKPGPGAKYTITFQGKEYDSGKRWWGIPKESLQRVLEVGRGIVVGSKLRFVLDPTCGSGTTAYVAEQWGRRWITCDVSRVPFALARQRLLTATFPWYELKNEERGPAGGFVYKRKQNNKGEEVGGIVPPPSRASPTTNHPPRRSWSIGRKCSRGSRA